MYVERRSTVLPAVVWTTTAAPDAVVVPDGCMDLIWFGDHLLVAGPDTRPQPAGTPGGAEVVGVRFAPGVGPLVVGVPAVELRDARVPLDAVWDAGLVRRLSARLQESRDLVGDLETVAGDRLRQPVPADLPALVALIGRGAKVSAVADRLGLSERQLHRRSLASFGYGPKVLGRILRFSRASRLLRSGMSRADAAAAAGYADQPHLTREFRSLAGSPAGSGGRSGV